MEHQEEEYNATQLAAKQIKDAEDVCYWRVDVTTLDVVMTDKPADFIEVFDTFDEAVDALHQYKMDALIEDGSQIYDLCMECGDNDCDGCND